jgi:hypothetical protein
MDPCATFFGNVAQGGAAMPRVLADTMLRALGQAM